MTDGVVGSPAATAAGSDGPVRVTPGWLALREPADAAARPGEFAETIARRLAERQIRAGAQELTIHDLGAGTGSVLRWLAPLLPGPQRWVLHDSDAELARHAHCDGLRAARDQPVRVEYRIDDVTRLAATDLAGADLITASALVDILTADEIRRLVTACATASCPALLSLGVTGVVAMNPPHPLDATLMVAFNEHQRRPARGGRLLGPEGADFAAGEFAVRNYTVSIMQSPWLLGGDERAPTGEGPPDRGGALAAEWLRGWVDAGIEQRPDLARDSRTYLRTRDEQIARGELTISVGHIDVLALPRNTT